MIEKGKTALLAFLVALSLVQSYFLAYNMPNREAKVSTEQDYVRTDPLGPEDKIENMLFPEMLVIHRGDDKHTVFYPHNATFYDEIVKKLQGREFKGFQRQSAHIVDWDQVRRDDPGIELRFARAIPFEMLQRVFKIDADFLFSRDSIDRIWIFSRRDREEVRTFFFSSDGQSVYESQRADLTSGDVAGYVGFGEYWPAYRPLDGGDVYVPEAPVTGLPQMRAGLTRYTSEQMLRNLFDPGATRVIPDRSGGTELFTDGKRGLKVAVDTGWMTYDDPVAPTAGANDLIDNVMAAVQFVNRHGGWGGSHLLVNGPEPDNPSMIRFRQYYARVPVISGEESPFGFIGLTLQQGAVASFERSLLVPAEEPAAKSSRTLPGGDTLRQRIAQAAGGAKVEALLPAYRFMPNADYSEASLVPVWAIRLAGGQVKLIVDSV